MNFQNISKIETPQKYIDKIIKSTKNKENKKLKLRGTLLQKVKHLELNRIHKFKEEFEKEFNTIQTKFPSIDDMSKFYIELLKLYIEPSEVKQALGAIKWIVKKNNEFFNEYSRKILSSRTIQDVKLRRKEYIGRAISLIKRIKKNLSLLEETRKVLIRFPDIKECYTVCIYGFPNVGKSTLLSKLTEAKPEIKEYPFTTKSINSGFIVHPYKKIQLLDVPGTLNREKMNIIEKIADLSIRYLANSIIYIFDLTEPYPLEEQWKLFEYIRKKVNPRIIIYFSKTDIIGNDIIEKFVKKQKIKEYYLDINKLKEKLLSIS